MYQVKQIKCEVKEYFRDNFIYYEDTHDMIRNVQQSCIDILESNIEQAIIEIKRLRNLYKNTQELPIWFRHLVAEVIYRYLSSGGKKKQTEIIQDMGLVKDIFRKEHWNMYSPYMKFKQEKYTSLSLPLNYAEVECNDVFRAMIHYMICHADIATDKIVDVFGKYGYVLATCANGYKYREVYAMDDSWLKFYQLGLKDKMKAYENLQQFQKRISSCDKMYEKEKFISDKLEEIMLNILKTKGKGDKFDYAQFAVDQFFYLCFLPEYWMDKNRSKEKRRVSDTIDLVKGEEAFVAGTDMPFDKFSKKKIEKFVNMGKKTFVEYCDSIQKVKCIEADYEEVLERVFQEDSRALLYIDVPKYIREYDRFNFSNDDMVRLIKLLAEYSGNWIMTWKTYIFQYPKQNTKKGKVYRYEVYKDKLKEEYHLSLYDYRSILEELKFINDEIQPLYVFRYKDCDQTTTNSLVFITNIELADITIHQFKQRYSDLPQKKGEELRMEHFGEFMKKQYKWNGKASGNS
jgi:hypothetical protein